MPVAVLSKLADELIELHESVVLVKEVLRVGVLEGRPPTMGTFVVQPLCRLDRALDSNSLFLQLLNVLDSLLEEFDSSTEEIMVVQTPESVA